LKLQTVNPSTRAMGVMAGVAAVLLLVGIFAYVSESENLRTARNTLRDKEAQVEAGKKVATRLQESEQNFADTQAQLACLETSVSTYAYVPTLLSQLEQLGRSLDLKVVAVKPLPAPPAPVAAIKRTSQDAQAAPETASSPGATTAKKADKPYEELKIDIEVEGNYWCTRSFIYRLTRFPKILSVNEVQLSPAGVVTRKRSPRLQASLNVTAFIFPAESPQNNSTTPTGPADQKAAPGALTDASVLKWRSGSEG
jgi:Tfp pilus assembly protein PilO